MVEFNPLASRQAGYAYVGNAMDDIQRRRAGRQVAQGQYGDAAGTLASGGLIQEGLQLQQQQAAQAAAARTARTAEQENETKWIVQGLDALAQVPYEQRKDIYQRVVRPQLAQNGFDESELAQFDSADYTDEELRAGRAALGGTNPAAPSGYRWNPDGTQAFIPGGPEDPANQRWQVTPYGMIPPAGWSPPAGQAPQASATPEYVDQLPPGVRPRPNAAPSARSSGGAERNQTPRVSFDSSGQARGAVQQIVPGVRVTNADRTPADTARIRRQGYNPSDTSFHLRGQALDLTPPSGMTMAQLESKMREAGFRVLNEGHHVHVSW